MTKPKKSDMKQIAVIIPCYNEASTIGKVVREFAAALPGAQIIVGDNNSRDDTADVARDAGTLVISEPRQGKGNMLRTLFNSVDADCYLMVDGDATYPADSARLLCDKVLNEGCDMALGDRLSSTYFTVNRRRFHNSGNKMMRSLINWMCHSNVQDILTGYRALSRRFVENFPLRSQGFEVETEMTVHALEHSFKVDSVPVDYQERRLPCRQDCTDVIRRAPSTAFLQHHFSRITAFCTGIGHPCFHRVFQDGTGTSFPHADCERVYHHARHAAVGGWCDS